jgi:mannitol/fructose-specific phosphotransferase system IIA component (Ntr-type)
MLEKYLTEELVVLDYEVESPEEAIRKSGRILFEAGKVDESYIEGMIETYHQLGAYIALAPSIAMPHARPGEWVFEPCVCFLRLAKPIEFQHPENDPIQMIFALGGREKESHIDMLRALSLVLMDPAKVEALKVAKNYKDVLLVISDAG